MFHSKLNKTKKKKLPVSLSCHKCFSVIIVFVTRKTQKCFQDISNFKFTCINCKGQEPNAHGSNIYECQKCFQQYGNSGLTSIKKTYTNGYGLGYEFTTSSRVCLNCQKRIEAPSYL